MSEHYPAESAAAGTSFAPAASTGTVGRAPLVVVRAPVAGDARAWHALFDDAAVMRWIGDGSIRDLAYYEAFVAQETASFAEHGWGLGTVEVDGTVAGFVGVHRWTADWGPTGRMEIGWRLGRAFWGRGIATTAARSVLDALPGGVDGATARGLVAVIQEDNSASARVAGRLGMVPAEAYDVPGRRGERAVVHRRA